MDGINFGEEKGKQQYGTINVKISKSIREDGREESVSEEKGREER